MDDEVWQRLLRLESYDLVVELFKRLSSSGRVVVTNLSSMGNISVVDMPHGSRQPE